MPTDDRGKDRHIIPGLSDDTREGCVWTLIVLLFLFLCAVFDWLRHIR